MDKIKIRQGHTYWRWAVLFDSKIGLNYWTNQNQWSPDLQDCRRYDNQEQAVAVADEIRKAYHFSSTIPGIDLRVIVRFLEFNGYDPKPKGKR